MAQIETWINCDLLKPVPVLYPPGQLFSQDNKGNKIGVNVTSGGEPVSLTGYGVVGYCVLATGTVIAIAGSTSSNKASIILPDSAYAVPGPINIIIKLTQGTDVTTIGAVVSTVFGLGNVVDPSQSTIDEWTAQINAAIALVEGNSVRYDVTQSLTTTQKNRARNNIGANPVVTALGDGDYKITLP